MTSEVVLAPMSRMIVHEPSSSLPARSALTTENGATPMISGEKPADVSAPVMASTWSTFAAMTSGSPI